MSLAQYVPGGSLGAYVPPNYARGLANRAALRAARALGNTARRGLQRWASRIYEQRNARSAKTTQRRRATTRQASRGVQMEIGGGAGESKSITVVGSSGKAKKFSFGPLSKAIGPAVRRTSAGDTALCIQGAQNAILLGNHLEAADITALFTQYSQTTQAFNSARVLIQEVVGETMMVNSSSTHLHCTIYDVMARVDGFTTVNTDPVSLFAAAGADASGGTSNDDIRVGYTPYDSPRFTAAYKILKATKIILSSGQIHNHVFKYNVNRLVSQERVTLNGIGPIGGLTVYSFVVFHGTPVHDEATELVITTGAGKVDLVRTEAIRFQQILQTNANNSITTNLGTVEDPQQWTENSPADINNET